MVEKTKSIGGGGSLMIVTVLGRRKLNMKNSKNKVNQLKNSYFKQKQRVEKFKKDKSEVKDRIRKSSVESKSFPVPPMVGTVN